MCLFPKAVRPKIYRSCFYEPIREDRLYIPYYKCGCCPECLSEKSRYWALRCAMEAKDSPAMMITLTYDTYVYNERGEIVGEEVDKRSVSKRDCQLFIKRLRKHFSPVRLKYLISAEYGKRTGRSHYHALIFGATFPDCVPYKKSKRGHQIFRSQTLARIWGNGICTVDCLNPTASVARYCTKYCAKDSGRSDLFMLFSHGIGERRLLNEFNGISYVVSGRTYPIPRTIWQKYIEAKYKPVQPLLSFRYKNPLNDLRKKLEAFPVECYSWLEDDIRAAHKVFEANKVARFLYRHYRNRDALYQRYLAHWSRLCRSIERLRKPRLERILALPDTKYFAYKQKALSCFNSRAAGFQISTYNIYPYPKLVPHPAPRSKLHEILFTCRNPLS